MSSLEQNLKSLLKEVRACTLCKKHLPYEPNPILRAQTTAKMLIIGQAPGTRVHQTGIPWNDPSGDRLRQWMGIDRDLFYNENHIAIVPMGFCYPGKGKSGDNPPRPECAVLWHEKILKHLPDLKLILLIGQYAQEYYLQSPHKTLKDRVKDFKSFDPLYLPLPHPSPRNIRWFQQNPWFEKDVVSYLRKVVKKVL